MSEFYELPKLAFSVREACAASSLGKTTLYSHISAGRLKAVRVGGRTLIPADSLHTLLKGKEQGQ
jgi:excisionase family DNA binding protein